MNIATHTGLAIAMMAGVLLRVFPAEGHTIIYVDDDASTHGNGGRWNSAFNDLQDALAVSTNGAAIRVGGGLYVPSARSEPHTPRTETFRLRRGVALQGGYAGLADPGKPDVRDFDLYESILSGDIGTFGVMADNCYHVVTGSGTDATAVLDGFTIASGNADGSAARNEGGGIHNSSGSPTVVNCTFSGNRAYSGGGMCNSSSTPTVINCTFNGNSADYGGGMYNSSSSPTTVNCTLSGNAAMFGGGMYNSGASAPTVTDCTFNGNSGGYYAGGMCNEDSSPTLANCAFSGNQAPYGGGLYNLSSSPTVANCTFCGNRAYYGGGMFNGSSSGPTLTSSILWENTASSNPQVFTDESSVADVTYSCIQDWPGGGEGNIDVDPLFVDADGPDGIFGTEDDDLHLTAGSPCIDTGDPSYDPEGATDPDGHARVLCGRVDMGVYEFGIGDYDCDRDVDLTDFANWPACMTGPDSSPYGAGCEAFDFEYDLDVDLADLAGFLCVFEG